VNYRKINNFGEKGMNSEEFFINVIVITFIACYAIFITQAIFMKVKSSKHNEQEDKNGTV